MARDVTRDVVRGINVLEMAFVNICSVPWTNHAGYIDQPTYADHVFPCFAFLSGMSRASTTRSIALVGLGLGLNAFTAYLKSERVRLPGVLQRLGIASILASNFEILPLVALWYFVSLALGNSINPFAHPSFPHADPSQTAQTKIDTFLFGNAIYTPTYDPEGLLGALTTAVSMLIGRQSLSMTMLQASISGVAMIALGEALHINVPKFAPLSKSLWTPSFVLVTSGISLLKYASVRQLVPYLPAIARSCFIALGRRSLEIYLLSSCVESLLMLGGHRSVWFTTMSQLEKVMSRTVADLSMSLAFTASMAAAAVVMVRMKLRLF